MSASTDELADEQTKVRAQHLAKTVGDAFDVHATIRSSPQLDATQPSQPPNGPQAGTDDDVSAALHSLSNSRIEIGPLLGEGGMGVVHSATQRALGRSVAVKRLRPELQSPALVDRLLREALVTGMLEHPNVVPVYDVGVDSQGAVMIVLKRIEGHEWAAVMHDGNALKDRHQATDALYWNLEVLMQVCQAMRYAHERGIIHRDLKPENVMIGEFGEIYVVDWGLAVALKPEPTGRVPTLDQVSGIAGTLAYMAPEMLAEAQPQLDERTDVYLLGAILFELVTGRAPHDGENVHAVVMAIVNPKREWPDSAPAELVAIGECAMALSPDDRFATVDEFRLALKAFLNHRGSLQLASAAERQLAKVEALIEQGGEDAAVRGAFSVSRFGFRQSLREWADNPHALSGEDRAFRTMIDFELAGENPSAAALLLADFPRADSALKARVEAAAKAERGSRERVLELERFQRERDPKIGERTRVFLAFVLGIVWTAGPLVLHFVPALSASHGVSILATGAMFVIVLASLVWARDTMGATVFNQRVVAASLTSMVGLMALHVVAHSLGLSVASTQVLYSLVWSVTIILLGLPDEKWLLFPGLVQAGLMFVAAAYLEYRFVLMAIGNVVLIGTVIFRWRESAVEMIKERFRGA